MTGQHPWLKHSPEKIKGKLDAVSFDAAGLWHCVQVYLGANGGDGSIELSRLSLATARKLTAARCAPLVVELVAEGLMELQGETRVCVVPWEQPPVDVWTDDVKRFKWRRAKELDRMPQLKEQLRVRDRNLCRYCGVKINWSDKRGDRGATWDHVDPMGPNTPENVVVACRKCNLKIKKDRPLEHTGMSLLRPGTLARPDAASGAQSVLPEQRARDGDLDRIQVGSESDLDPGPDPPRAPTRLRTDPNRTQIRSRSGAVLADAGSSALVHGCGSDGGCERVAGCECPFIEGVVAGG